MFECFNVSMFQCLPSFTDVDICPPWYNSSKLVFAHLVYRNYSQVCSFLRSTKYAKVL
jgi:hypothetical protein